MSTHPATKPWLVCAGVTLSLALSACGSTVQTAQGVSSAGSVGDGLSVSAPTGGGSATPGLDGAPSGAAGAAFGPSAAGRPGAVGGSGTAVGQVPSAAASAVKNGRGVTATTVTIGVPVVTGEGEYADSLGIKGASSTLAVKDLVNAAVADVNRSGGVLGRKVLVYFHEVDLATYVANPAQAVARLCADFRDDHKVFAVLFSITGSPDLRKCLADMGSPLIGGNGTSSLVPASAYWANGGNYLYGPNAITIERLAYLYIQSLMDRSFMEKWDTSAGGPGGTLTPKIGLIHVDTPDTHALYNAYGKELAKYGHKYDEKVTYAQDLAAGLAATKSAILRFRTNGITHVFGASAFFLQEAEAQGYRPRYAYLPGLGALGAANVPPAQMRGALTVGWTPTTDVNESEDPGDTPGAANCRAVMKRAGLQSAARRDHMEMYNVCDSLHSFRTAMLAGQALTVSGLRRGYESLGATFRTALTFKAILNPTRHAGVDSVRDMAYDMACSCLKYTSRTDRS